MVFLVQKIEDIYANLLLVNGYNGLGGSEIEIIKHMNFLLIKITYEVF